MRTAAHVLAASLALSLVTSAAAAPILLESRSVQKHPRGLSASPSGHQLAVIHEDGLRLVELAEDGALGRTDWTLDLPDLAQVAFSPRGGAVVCATTDGRIHIVRRDNQQVTTLAIEGADRPEALVTSMDRKEIYVLDRSGRVTTVHLPRRQVVSAYDPGTGENWHWRDACLSRNCWYLIRCADYRPTPEIGIATGLLVHTTGEPYQQYSTTCAAPIACCIGPDDDHFMVLGENRSTLVICSVAEGTTADSYDFGAVELEQPVDIGSSPDHRWTVIADRALNKLKAVVGFDLRSRLLGAQERPMDYDVPLGCPPDGVVTHPNLQVAYTWSEGYQQIGVIALGETPDE